MLLAFHLINILVLRLPPFTLSLLRVRMHYMDDTQLRQLFLFYVAPAASESTYHNRCSVAMKWENK